jgi:hypothetical protein
MAAWQPSKEGSSGTHQFGQRRHNTTRFSTIPPRSLKIFGECYSVSPRVRRQTLVTIAYRHVRRQTLVTGLLVAGHSHPPVARHRAAAHQSCTCTPQPNTGRSPTRCGIRGTEGPDGRTHNLRGWQHRLYTRGSGKQAGMAVCVVSRASPRSTGTPPKAVVMLHAFAHTASCSSPLAAGLTVASQYLIPPGPDTHPGLHAKLVRDMQPQSKTERELVPWQGRDAPCQTHMQRSGCGHMASSGQLRWAVGTCQLWQPARPQCTPPKFRKPMPMHVHMHMQTDCSLVCTSATCSARQCSCKAQQRTSCGG